MTKCGLAPNRRRTMSRARALPVGLAGSRSTRRSFSCSTYPKSLKAPTAPREVTAGAGRMTKCVGAGRRPATGVRARSAPAANRG